MILFYLVVWKGLIEIFCVMLKDFRVGFFVLNKGCIIFFYCVCLGGNLEVCVLFLDGGVDVIFKVFSMIFVLSLVVW